MHKNIILNTSQAEEKEFRMLFNLVIAFWYDVPFYHVLTQQI